MKNWSVLLRKDNGTEDTVQIEAENKNDARWAGKKIHGVFEAVVLKRVSEDNRKNNGGARPNTGPKANPNKPEKQRVTLELETSLLQAAKAKHGTYADAMRYAANADIPDR